MNKQTTLLSSQITKKYLTGIFLLCLFTLTIFQAQAQGLSTRSSSIALSKKSNILVNVNHDANSVTVFSVRNKEQGNNALRLLGEIPVGQEPHCVAIRNNREAFVTNAASGTVSVVSLRGKDRNTVVATIAVGTEPRGCALSNDGRSLFVANHTAGTVSVIDTKSRLVIDNAPVGGNPWAIAVMPGASKNQSDLVFVTQFYASLIPGGPGEGFDNGKQGRVQAFPANNPQAITDITLSPIENAGFTADRSAFCPQNNPALHDPIFCPDVTVAGDDPIITADPQGAYPNQLQSLVIRNQHLYLPNVGVAPEPPVRFNVNVQALVHTVDTFTLQENQNLHRNLNNDIKTEVQPGNPQQSLDRLFGNNLVDIDCDPDGNFCLLVSSGTNVVMRASIQDDGSLNIGAPNVVRMQTGNLPSGIVIDRRGERAYVNNEINRSVSVLNLANNTVIARDIAASRIPEPGTFEHRVAMGKLVFFTALGTPDNGLGNLPIRNVDPLAFRDKASDNGWSSCASCHPSGLADGATWMFPTGPRQTIPLDGFYGKDSPAHNQRLSNWNAVRGSFTDFNNNSRNIQGGIGFAGDPPNANIFNHGITQGASAALDFETLWAQTIRPFNMPSNNVAAANAGRVVFADNCASCHGGSKWTKSQVFHSDNPTFDGNPLMGGQALDPGIANAGPQIISYTKAGKTLTFLEDAGTFNNADALEIRGAGGGIGITALGGLGFNVPSLLGVAYSAPYFHHGSAQTLGDVFTQHDLGGQSIANTLNAGQLANLEAFLETIDGKTLPLRSEADDFRDNF